MKYDFRSKQQAEFPSMLVVAITNACQFECVHCFHPVYRRQPDYHRYDMPETMFRRIADELGHYSHSILRLIGWGEPMLHPRITDFVAYVRRVAPANPVTLITNGYHLDARQVGSLLAGDIDLIEVSIDAADPDHYARVRRSAFPRAFEVVERNVKDAIRQRDAGRHSTRIAVSFIAYDTEASRAEYAAFERRWSGLADEVIRRPAHSFKGVVQGINLRPGPRSPCYGLWSRCNINPWGQINVCYNDWENRYVLGDLRDQATSIAGVWQGAALTRLRAEQSAGLFCGICGQCRDYNPDAWNKPYEHVVARCSAGRYHRSSECIDGMKKGGDRTGAPGS